MKEEYDENFTRFTAQTLTTISCPYIVLLVIKILNIKHYVYILTYPYISRDLSSPLA